MTVHVTSDTHFGHGGALGIFRRPFGSVAEMNEALVARWNEAVSPDDEVWHLGDFAVGLGAAAMQAILDRLAGRKHLILGNNDGDATAALAGWESVGPYCEIEHDGRRVVLCHYPFRSWRDMGRGAVNLHGHSHGRLAPLPRQLDVGVDARDFRPVALGNAVAVAVARRRARS